MSTPVFVNPEISTQPDRAQSPRVLVPFLEDPYEAIRQAYLVETETPESPHIVASPTLLPDSTPPTRHAEDFDTSGARPTSSYFITPLSLNHPLTHASSTLVLFPRRIARMAMRVPPVMSHGLSSSIAEVAVMSDSAFLEDDKEEDDKDEDEDKEIEESSDSDSKSEDAEDEGPTTKDEDLVIGDEGLAARDEGPGMRVKSLGLGGDAAVPEGQ
ncbi:hypothetical protein Tco_0845770 [Tanacetum coccineum]